MHREPWLKLPWKEHIYKHLLSLENSFWNMLLIWYWHCSWNQLQTELDHNEFNVGDRGAWRKFNPNNPYVESADNGGMGNELKVESLDDLFDDEIENDSEDFPMPKVEDNGPSDIDIQKELEAKFDELFGPLEDED